MRKFLADGLHPAQHPLDAGAALLTAALMRRWIIGILASWAIVWAAGPLVVNSILVRVDDPALGVATLRPGDVIRWRSEGWANTLIGPHGLPGWRPNGAATRIVLWGDSQVEGVCVRDEEKIHQQVIDIAQSSVGLQIDCLPLGRSGADARLWRDLTAEAQTLWDPALHIWVVTELSDLTVIAALQRDQEPTGQEPGRWQASPDWVRVAAALRAEALFAAGRRMLLSPVDGQRRRLDFSVGPRADHVQSPVHAPVEDAQLVETLATEIHRLSTQYGGALVIVYAPATPTLGRPLNTAHPDDDLFERIREALSVQQIPVIDMRDEFVRLWETQRRLPRGFHNGLPGYGHLNAEGNQLIATAIAGFTAERLGGASGLGPDAAD